MERPGTTNRMQALIGVGVFFIFMMGMSSVAVAADGDGVAEAASSETGVGLEHAMRDQILQTIEATRQADPELAVEMERQLQMLESGQLDPRTLEIRDQELTHGTSPQPGELPGGTPLPMPVVDGGGRLIGSEGGAGDSLPPEARKELEELFRQGTGDPNSEKDRALREKAGEILEKYGVEPREMEAGHEGKGEYGRESSHEFGAGLERGEGFERALEQMAPEAREQMERHFGQEREQMEGMQREFESAERTFEAPTRDYEATPREVESPSREYEAPTHEYEAPAREYETPTREYEAPMRETTSEAPQREQQYYEAPEQYREPQYQQPPQP